MYYCHTITLLLYSGTNETSVVSPIISSALRCESSVCNTSIAETEQPVHIELAVENEIARMHDLENASLICVFWEIL